MDERNLPHSSWDYCFGGILIFLNLWVSGCSLEWKLLCCTAWGAPWVWALALRMCAREKKDLPFPAKGGEVGHSDIWFSTSSFRSVSLSFTSHFDVNGWLGLGDESQTHILVTLSLHVILASESWVSFNSATTKVPGGCLALSSSRRWRRCEVLPQLPPWSSTDPWGLWGAGGAGAVKLVGPCHTVITALHRIPRQVLPPSGGWDQCRQGCHPRLEELGAPLAAGLIVSLCMHAWSRERARLRVRAAHRLGASSHGVGGGGWPDAETKRSCSWRASAWPFLQVGFSVTLYAESAHPNRGWLLSWGCVCFLAAQGFLFCLFTSALALASAFRCVGEKKEPGWGGRRLTRSPDPHSAPIPPAFCTLPLFFPPFLFPLPFYFFLSSPPFLPSLPSVVGSVFWYFLPPPLRPAVRPRPVAPCGSVRLRGAHACPRPQPTLCGPAAMRAAWRGAACWRRRRSGPGSPRPGKELRISHLRLIAWLPRSLCP